jgi:hypothetical protein
LCIDTNEAVPGTSGKVLSVDYTLEKPIVAKGHNGTIAMLVRSYGLQDPLLRHHIGPLPPTHNHGKDRIDFIFTSPRVMACTRSGLFPFQSIFMGDYMACFLDLEASLMFQKTTAAIEPPKYQGLQCYDPRIVSKHKEILHKHITYHKLGSSRGTINTIRV